MKGRAKIYLVIHTLHNGYIHVVGRGGKFFVFAASEDVNSNHVHLSVTVLAGLRCGHINDLAGTVLDNHEAVLLDRRALHGDGGRRTGVGIFELLNFLFFGHLYESLRIIWKGGCERRAEVRCRGRVRRRVQKCDNDARRILYGRTFSNKTS